MDLMTRAGRMMVVVAVGLCCRGIFAQETKAHTPIDVADRPQLMIDRLFFESVENVSLRIVTPIKTGERTLVSDKPWEDATLNWFSVMEDGGVYRMWYECYDAAGWPTSDDTSFCYAESKDGIHWDKPSLGLFSYQGSADNNIVFRQVGGAGAHSRVHGSCVFKDPNAPPDARYKAVSQGAFAGFEPPQRVAGMYSADGLHWTRYDRPICDVFADSQYSGFWDEQAGRYVLYGRVPGRGRAIGRTASGTLEHFEPPALVLEHEPDVDVYNPAAIKYAYADGVYLMFPSLYRHATDTLDIHLAVSRDGIHWTWPEPGTPFVALGEPGAFDSGSLYMGQGMLRSGNELWLYYSGSILKHNEAELDALAKPENRRVFSRVVARADGLVAAEAGDTPGYFITPPLFVKGATLRVNLRTKPDGAIQVALLDAQGAPLPGRATEDCVPLRGDHAAAAVTWKNGASISAGAVPIRLQITMTNASLFAFQFTP